MAQTPQFLPSKAKMVDAQGYCTVDWLLNLQAWIQGLAGAGDVDGPSSATNGTIVLFDGTTGALIKAATGTGIVFAASGVASFGSILTDTTYIQGGPITAAGATIGASTRTRAAVNASLQMLCGGL